MLRLAVSSGRLFAPEAGDFRCPHQFQVSTLIYLTLSFHMDIVH